MLKRCRNCGITFETERSRILCDDCKGYRATNKPKAKVSISIPEMSKIIKKHNDKYGTSYTYGEFCNLVKQKKITIRNGGSFEKRLP